MGGIHAGEEMFNLENIIIDHADLSGANCCSINFKNASMKNSLLYGCDFTNANLEGANLEKVDFKMIEINTG